MIQTEVVFTIGVLRTLVLIGLSRIEQHYPRAEMLG